MILVQSRQSQLNLKKQSFLDTPCYDHHCCCCCWLSAFFTLFFLEVWLCVRLFYFYLARSFSTIFIFVWILCLNYNDNLIKYVYVQKLQYSTLYYRIPSPRRARQFGSHGACRFQFFLNVCTTYACTNFFRGSAISMYWFGEKMHSVTNKNIGPTD